jgi:hypothetical protein
MKKNVLGAMLVVLFLMAGSASAIPVTCSSLVTASGINVLAIGSCSEGNYVFSNFAVSNASAGVGTAEIDLTQGGATFLGGVASLNFNPNLGFGTTGGTITDLHFSFTVTALVGLITGAGLDNSSSINSSINEINCLTSSSTAGCQGTQVWNTDALSGQTTSCTGNTASITGGPGGVAGNPCAYGAGQSTVYVFKDISIGDPSTSHNTSFTETFVPEPMTLSLMGLGLLGVGILGRRIRK